MIEFLNEEFFHGQKIFEQRIVDDELYVITRDKATGNYVLWRDNKKIMVHKNLLKLYEKLE